MFLCSSVYLYCPSVVALLFCFILFVRSFVCFFLFFSKPFSSFAAAAAAYVGDCAGASGRDAPQAVNLILEAVVNWMHQRPRGRRRTMVAGRTSQYVIVGPRARSADNSHPTLDLFSRGFVLRRRKGRRRWAC